MLFPCHAGQYNRPCCFYRKKSASPHNLEGIWALFYWIKISLYYGIILVSVVLPGGSLTGAMSLPLNPLVSGLATGICECMKDNTISFNCAFIQGSRTRLEGLSKDKYDFVIASQLTSTILLNQYPSIHKVMDLDGCAYSGKYTLLFRSGLTEVQDGMVVAFDSSSIDQVYLTNLVCQGKKIERFETSYINTRLSVINGSADFTVARMDAINPIYFSQCADLCLPDYTPQEIESFTNTVVLASSNNYGIDKLLSHVLQANKILEIQNQVINGTMPPLYY